MVNVAGRSKGCHTCRKRRVKCDERKPICTRCERGGFGCTGYEKVMQFVNTSAKCFSSQSDDSIISSSRRDHDHSRPKSGKVKIADELSLVAFKDEMCLTFIFENFVWRTYGNPWLEQAALGKIGNLAFTSCQALAKFNFGKYHHQQDIESDGSVKYGQTLSLLAPQLCRARSQGLETLIVPMLVVLLYASLAVDRAGAISHVRGLNQLLLVCGPENFQKQPLLCAFESCRSTLITTHLILKKRTFLESPEWLTVPWAINPESKSSQNQVVDVLVTVPGLFEDAEMCNAFAPSANLDSTVSRLRTQLKKLYLWRWQWEKAIGRAVREVQRPQLIPSTSRRQHIAYETTLHFETPQQCSEIMLYNTTLLFLLGLLWKLTPSCAREIVATASQPSNPPPHHLQSSPLFRPGETHTLRAPATEICRCYEYQVRYSKTNKDPSLFYLYPLALAGAVLKSDPLFAPWIRDMLQASPVTSGYGVDESNVYGFRFYLTEEALGFG